MRYAADLQRVWQRLLFEQEALRYSEVHLDGVYLHGLSEGMVDACGLIKFAAFMGTLVAFNGSDGRGARPDSKPGEAWPGAEWYIERLIAAGVRKEKLFPTRPGLHSRDECDAFVELARDKGWKNFGIITAPYHWPRSMSCLVGAMKKAKYELNVYMLPPRGVIQWDLEILGSQGATKTTYDLESGDDVYRLFDYWYNGGGDGAIGYGAGYPAMKDYLNRRNAGKI